MVLKTHTKNEEITKEKPTGNWRGKTGVMFISEKFEDFLQIEEAQFYTHKVVSYLGISCRRPSPTYPYLGGSLGKRNKGGLR